MEERILDEDESRGIKLKRTQDGGTDAVDALAEEGAENPAEDELFLAIPEEDYDDDLVGLTPTQLREELERREKLKREAQEQSAQLAQEGTEKLAAKDFAGAAVLFGQALMYDGENAAAREGLWAARTENFASEEGLFGEGVAEELASDDAARALVLEKMGETLQTLRDSYQKEEAETAPEFEEKQTERREAFSANRRYYAVRFAVFFVLAVAFAVGVAVSSGFLLRTQSDWPVILMAAFGGLTLVALLVTIFFARKLYVAVRLCRENERLASTETGARIKFLRERLEALGLILGGAESEDEAE